MFEKGDRVSIRLVDGVINKKLINKMYEVLMGENTVIRHIDQLRKSYKTCSQKFELNDDDWAPDAGSQKVEKRYPVRERRPPIRYGIDE